MARAGPTDGGIYRCCEIYNGESLILSHKMKIENTNNQTNSQQKYFLFIYFFLLLLHVPAMVTDNYNNSFQFLQLKICL